jgi:hypothetical protein
MPAQEPQTVGSVAEHREARVRDRITCRARGGTDKDSNLSDENQEIKIILKITRNRHEAPLDLTF